MVFVSNERRSEMKTSELQGAALDWAVAKCEGIIWEQGDLDACEYGPGFKPSTDWAQGGPIIEREGIELFRNNEKNYWFTSKARNQIGTGPTPLIAAMRCYVASKLGDEIELPEELREREAA
jgi:hypothetical protein